MGENLPSLSFGQVGCACPAGTFLCYRPFLLMGVSFMYCSSCGIQLPDSFRFCSQCGCATGKAGFTSDIGKPARHLSRPRDDRTIAGVCAGIARYLGVDVTLVRVLVACFALWPPFLGLAFYIVCWIVMPTDPLLLGPARVQDDVMPNAAT